MISSNSRGYGGAIREWLAKTTWRKRQIKYKSSGARAPIFRSDRTPDTQRKLKVQSLWQGGVTGGAEVVLSVEGNVRLGGSGGWCYEGRRGWEVKREIKGGASGRGAAYTVSGENTCCEYVCSVGVVGGVGDCVCGSGRLRKIAR